MTTTASTSSAPPPTAVRARRRWWQYPFLWPLAAATVIFLATSLPRYVGLDPSRSLVPTDRGPLFYPALVTHIFFGSVVLACGVLQLWPWLRARHPRVHRWSGRAYVLSAVPMGLAALVTAQFPAVGVNQQVANTFLGVLFLGTTVAGYLAARQRRFADHREWMLRSYALAFSIVTNRLWGFVLMMIFVPDVFTDASIRMDSPEVAGASSASAWVSWIVNLLLVEWWIRRSDPRRGKPAVRAQRSRAGHDVSAEVARRRVSPGQ